jgi:hypothetical protein
VFLLGGVSSAALGRYAYVHADDCRDISGGAGSWMSPGTRRVWAAVLIVIGLAMAAAGALAPAT